MRTTLRASCRSVTCGLNLMRQLSGACVLQVRFRLDFDNSEYMAGEARRRGRLGLDAALLPAVPCTLLLRLFPFGVVIGRDLQVVAAGEKLQWRGRTRVTGAPFASLFRLRRPRVDLDWKTVSA